MHDTKRVTPERLRSFFRPKSIALVGATDNSRWSLFTYRNLRSFNFAGSVYCVNPSKDTVHGEKAYRSVLDIREPIELAYVMVSTKHLLPVMQEAADAGIRHLVLLTSGFSEIGTEGRKLEEKVLRFARDHDQVILGPNGNGFIHVTEQLAPYGLPLAPPLTPGPVGVVLQSGALASQVMTLAQARNVGLSLLTSMGNETMISMTDVVDYLIEDKNTKVIALFLESIRQPEEFARVANKALKNGKAIVVLKIGRSSESARTAMAHTGSLVGNDTVNDAAFHQLGVVRVQSLEDLITTAGLLGYIPNLPGRNMGVVTPSGGACDILSDRAGDENILLPEFAPRTVKNLQTIVPEFSTVHNPLDVTGYVVVDGTLMVRALEVVMDDPNLDFILCLLEPPRINPDDPSPVFEQYEKLKEMLKHSTRPVIFIMNIGVDITPFGRTLIEKNGIHFVGGMEHGMTAIGKALWWNEKRDRYRKSFPSDKPSFHINTKTNDNVVSWPEHNAKQYLEKQGAPVVPGILATSSKEAVNEARKIGYPVVMKIQSENIAHKSDIGGVALNLQSDLEVKEAYQTMLDNVEKEASHIDGVLMGPMRQKGTELLVGIIKDPLWGYVLTVGLGGIFVEVFKDTSLRVLPVERKEIMTMLEELKGAPLLKGARGGQSVDLNFLADVIYKITEAAGKLSDSLETLEVNPLLVQGAQVEALDVLIRSSETSV